MERKIFLNEISVISITDFIKKYTYLCKIFDKTRFSIRSRYIEKKTIFNRKRKIGFEKFNIYFMGWYSLVVELKIETEKNMFVN